MLRGLIGRGQIVDKAENRGDTSSKLNVLGREHSFKKK
jgi:hypothetical protein